MGSSPPPAPDPVDPGVAQGEYLFGKNFGQFDGVTDPRAQERIIASEAQFRPQYAELNLNDWNSYLNGINGGPGVLSMQDQAAQASEATRAATTSSQRASDITDVQNLGAQATEAFRASDPYTQGLLSSQNALSQDLYARAQGVTPQQSRAADQQAREAFGARGRLNDNAGVAAEILGREDVLRQNRAEAQDAGARTLTMNQATAVDPFQAILGRMGNSGAMGNALMGQAGGLLGSSTPQLFNPDAGINLALQNAANQANYQSSVYGAQEARTGAIISGIAQGAGSAIKMSDSRLKSRIRRIGTLPNGLGWYSYRFDPTGEMTEGVMAQEAMEVSPGAVSVHESGYLMVNYSKL
jgi:hypothetical protein